MYIKTSHKLPHKPLIGCPPSFQLKKKIYFLCEHLLFKKGGKLINFMENNSWPICCVYKLIKQHNDKEYYIQYYVDIFWKSLQKKNAHSNAYLWVDFAFTAEPETILYIELFIGLNLTGGFMVRNLQIYIRLWNRYDVLEGKMWVHSLSNHNMKNLLEVVLDLWLFSSRSQWCYTTLKSVYKDI